MSIKDKGAIWTTAQGERLEVIWMDSKHLFHSANMVARAGKPNTALHRELESRGFSSLSGPAPNRETKEQMYWVRALIDSGRDEALSLFYRNPAIYIEHLLSSADPKNQRTVALAMKHRLTR